MIQLNWHIQNIQNIWTLKFFIFLDFLCQRRRIQPQDAGIKASWAEPSDTTKPDWGNLINLATDKPNQNYFSLTNEVTVLKPNLFNQ